VFQGLTFFISTKRGLVNAAQPESFKKIFKTMLESAGWWSNSPICMDLGKSGQGKNGGNLAARQSCSSLPETSCDHFCPAL
jgi:hypothetical protein